MPVLIDCRVPAPLGFSLARLRREAEGLLNLCNRPTDELSLLLTCDREMADLNARYRKRQGPTNVLAFAIQEGEGGKLAPGLLGDVVISLDTAAREAASEGVSLDRRLSVLLVHGILHLLGFDHERSEEEAHAMAAREEELLHLVSQQTGREKMTSLAINVDHVATLRQARGGAEPDPVLAAGICELAGAQGIVIHLREDRRHIQDRDLRLLKQTVKTRLNLEMGATEEIIGIALDLKPDMVTLVPEKRKELTTEGGLNVVGQKKKIGAAIETLAAADIPVSLFVDPESAQIRAARDLGATFVEIHTGRYADAASKEERDREFALIAESADEAFGLGLRVNAGHGLNYQNTSRIAGLKNIEELSIGHAVMARAIFVGLDQAVREMLALVSGNGPWTGTR